MNDYQKENYISIIKKALTFVKNNRSYSRYEKIIKGAKDIMTEFFEKYIESKKESFASAKAEYITSRIILAAKENKIKTLQQTYRECTEEYKEKFNAIKNIDKIAFFCTTLIKDTEEALELIYNNLDKYE